MAPNSHLSTDEGKTALRKRKGGLRLQGSQSDCSTETLPALTHPAALTAEMKFSKASGVSKCLCKATDTILVPAR